MRDDERPSSPGCAVDLPRPVALAAPVACASRDTRLLTEPIPGEIAARVVAACDTIERHLGATLTAIHLSGSALDGGLKPRSDVDLLVTVSAPPDESTRRALMLDLLAVSAPPGRSGGMRALEVTVVVQEALVPWRHPARRELQFGEWLRCDPEAGIVEPALVDHDVAILSGEPLAAFIGYARRTVESMLST